MFSKRFELSVYDRKRIAIYGAYWIVLLLVLFPTDVKEFLTAQGVGTWIISWLFTVWVVTLQKFLKDNSFDDPLNILDGSDEWAEDEDDILLEWESAMLDKLSKVATADTIRISYNQYADARTKSACTLFSPLGVASSIFNRQLTQSEIIELRDFAVKEFWYKVWQWAYFETGVRCVVKRWNQKFPNEKILYFKTQHGTEELRQVLLKWYGACGGYRGNAQYNKDRMDWILNGVNFWDTTYWHATSRHSINGEMRCYDSIPTMMRYRFANDPVKIRGRYKNCYVILPEKEVPKDTLNKLQQIRAKKWLANHNKSVW